MADLPRVTHILEAAGLGPDLSGIAPAVLEEARRRGSLVHAAIEAHAYGVLAPSDVTPEIKPYLDGYEAFLRDTGHVPIVSEYRVVHPVWQYAGTLDRVGWATPTVRSIDDFKAVATVDLWAVARQLAAYRLGWNAVRPSEPVGCVRAVQLLPGDYRLFEKEIMEILGQAEQEFLAALVVYQARLRRGRA